LKEFIVKVVNNYPNVKLVGISAGSLIIAEALGAIVSVIDDGQVDKLKQAGRGVINIKDEFYK
jgi:hypothetical protein